MSKFPIEQQPCTNTDKELWRKSDAFLSPSVHVTESGGIGISVAGLVIVMPVEKWHALAKRAEIMNLQDRLKARAETTRNLWLSTRPDNLCPSDIAQWLETDHRVKTTNILFNQVVIMEALDKILNRLEELKK